MGFGKDGKGSIIYESRVIAIGGLSVQTGLIITTKPAITEDFRMLKNQLIARITGLTAGEGEGLQLWLVEGDLSLAEFEAAIESIGPLSRHDVIGNELAMRFALPIGISRWTGETLTKLQFEGRDGELIMISKPRWTFGESTSWNWILYNDGTAITTGATIRLKSKSFGVWVE